MKNSKILLLGLFCLAFACVNSKPEDKQNEPSKPNIIFILADDLGYGDLGCYGQEHIRTPNIDEMAREGVLFTNHYAGSSVCAPSRWSLLTGKHTGHAYVRANFSDPIPDEEVTAAEMVKSAGYKTALIGKGHFWDKDTAGYPPELGFDLFVGYGNGVNACNSYPEWMWRNNDTIWLDNKVEYMTEGYAKGLSGIAVEKRTHSQDLFTKEAFQFIEENRDTSFYLFLSLTIPHANPQALHWGGPGIETPDMMGYDTTSWPKVQQDYAAYISYMDRDIGKLLDHLKTLGIDENTLVIFTSDNGPHTEGGQIRHFLIVPDL